MNEKNSLELNSCFRDLEDPLELFEINQKKDVVIEGVIFCPKCSRFFPIMEEIPIMLPDDLRDKKHEMEFLEVGDTDLEDGNEAYLAAVEAVKVLLENEKKLPSKEGKKSDK